jgi:hypothetical protein
MKILHPVVLLVSAMMFGASSQAEPDEELPQTGDTQVDAMHEAISERVALTAGWLDSFFANEQYLAESNQSSIRLSVSGFAEKGEGLDASTKLRLRLRLPGLENRALLFFNGQSDDIDTTDAFSEELEDRFAGRNQEGASAGLRYAFEDSPQRNTSIRAGVKFRSGSPAVFVKPRFRYFRPFSSFDLRFIQDATWYSDEGFEATTELQLERPVWDDWFFRSSARAAWYEDEDGLFPALGFNWRRAFEEHRVLSVSWDNYFKTEPTGVLDSSVFRVRYRQQLWRKWLAVEVAPQVAVPRDKDYALTPGILVKLEAVFQRQPK